MSVYVDLEITNRSAFTVRFSFTSKDGKTTLTGLLAPGKLTKVSAPQDASWTFVQETVIAQADRSITDPT